MSLSVPGISKAKVSDRSDSGRLKVALQPGRGLVDWIKLSSTKRLASRSCPVVDHVELVKHRSRDDCWILLADKVYDVTEYLSFHPGGEDELMRAAGRDGSALFNKYHSWINYEKMLEACFVGCFRGDRNKLGSPRASASEAMSFDKEYDEMMDKTLLQALGIKTGDWENGRLQFTNNCLPLFSNDNVSADVRDGSLRVLFRPYRTSPFEVTWKISRSLAAAHLSMEVDREGVALQLERAEDLKMFSSAKLLRVECDPYLRYLCYSIQDIRFVTHDSNLYVLSIPSSDCFSLPIGHHVNLRLKKKGSYVYRPYTPVMISKDRRRILFLIKIYSDGVFTPLLASLKPGDSIEMSDGIGREDIVHECANRVILLAAGTGLTPMVRLISARAQSSLRELYTLLLLFNKTEADVPGEDILRYCGVNIGDISFKIINYLSEPGDNWTGPTGIISRKILESHIHIISEEDAGYRVLLCGPVGFVDEALRLLKDLRVASSNIYVFQE